MAPYIHRAQVIRSNLSFIYSFIYLFYFFPQVRITHAGSSTPPFAHRVRYTSPAINPKLLPPLLVPLCLRRETATPKPISREWERAVKPAGYELPLPECSCGEVTAVPRQLPARVICPVPRRLFYTLMKSAAFCREWRDKQLAA